MSDKQFDRGRNTPPRRAQPSIASAAGRPFARYFVAEADELARIEQRKSRRQKRKWQR